MKTQVLIKQHKNKISIMYGGKEYSHIIKDTDDILDPEYKIQIRKAVYDAERLALVKDTTVKY